MEWLFPTSNASFLTCQFLIYNVSSWLENPFFKLEVNENWENQKKKKEVNEEKMLSGDRV